MVSDFLPRQSSYHAGEHLLTLQALCTEVLGAERSRWTKTCSLSNQYRGIVSAVRQHEHNEEHAIENRCSTTSHRIILVTQSRSSSTIASQPTDFLLKCARAVIPFGRAVTARPFKTSSCAAPTACIFSSSPSATPLIRHRDLWPAFLTLDQVVAHTAYRCIMNR